MAARLPDERTVFIACQDVFKEKDALIRRPVKIKELILRSKESPVQLTQLLEIHALDDIVVVVKGLLEAQVFESTDKAEKRFPGVLVAPNGLKNLKNPKNPKNPKAQNGGAKNTAARVVAMRSRVCRQRNIVHTDRQRLLQATVQNMRATTGSNLEGNTLALKKRRLPETQEEFSSSEMCIPFGTRHQILFKVQAILEEIAYDYAKKNFPECLKQMKWECPESVELNVWAKYFLRHSDKLPRAIFFQATMSLKEMILRLQTLRHIAVHRRPTNSKDFESLITTAEVFAKLLMDDKRPGKISRVRHEVNVSIQILKRITEDLDRETGEKLREINARRAELNNCENDVIRAKAEEIKAQQDLISLHFTDVLSRLDSLSEDWSAPPEDADTFQNRINKAFSEPLEDGEILEPNKIVNNVEHTES
ncbi:MAG: hypothetical protein M1825_004706 [Sarcosagium campestre]|nr:MAG: hypothetical protein M1825_004706 [Sarcosagium campestre]